MKTEMLWSLPAGKSYSWTMTSGLSFFVNFFFLISMVLFPYFDLCRRTLIRLKNFFLMKSISNYNCQHIISMGTNIVSVISFHFTNVIQCNTTFYNLIVADGISCWFNLRKKVFLE